MRIRDPSWSDQRWKFELEKHAGLLDRIASDIATKGVRPDTVKAVQVEADAHRAEAAKVGPSMADKLKASLADEQRRAAATRYRGPDPAPTVRPSPPMPQGSPTDPAGRAAYFGAMADDTSLPLAQRHAYRQLADDLTPEPTDAEKAARADDLHAKAMAAQTATETSTLFRMERELREEIQ